MLPPLPNISILPPFITIGDPLIVVVPAIAPMVIPFAVAPVPIVIFPFLVASSYKDTVLPTVLPVCVFVITDVSVDAPALKAPATVNNGAVIANPLKASVVDTPPIVIVLTPVPVPISIAPVLNASLYTVTDVPTAVPVIVFVVKIVGANVPAVRVPTTLRFDIVSSP